MTKATCGVCGIGNLNHGSALYAYYDCGHAYEKPLDSKDYGRWIECKSPYVKNYIKNEEPEWHEDYESCGDQQSVENDQQRHKDRGLDMKKMRGNQSQINHKEK